MRKLITKTALISFAAALGALLCFSLVYILAFPSAVSDAMYDFGMLNLSVNFAEKSYKKSENYGDLQTLVERAILAERTDITVKYATAFIENEGFYPLVVKQDGDDNLNRGSYFGYITGSLAVAYYVEGNEADALNVATVYANMSGYVEYNTVEYLMRAVMQANDKTFGNKLLEEMKKFAFDGVQNELLLKDIGIMEEFVG